MDIYSKGITAYPGRETADLVVHISKIFLKVLYIQNT
jgi:hypothetical protein